MDKNRFKIAIWKTKNTPITSVCPLYVCNVRLGGIRNIISVLYMNKQKTLF